MQASGAPGNVRVWDLPTRAFHWLLVASVIGLYVTGKIGGDLMPWHARFGYVTGSLLLFRLVWGFVGGRWSRFSSFAPTPGSLLRYMRSRAAQKTVGHNPLGALSVFAMLVFLLAQVTTGLFSADLGNFFGPLTLWANDDTVLAATRYHKRIGQVVILSLVALHLMAIAYYRFLRSEDLIAPMWHGNKRLAPGTPGSRDDMRSRWVALAIFVAFAALMTGVARVGAT